jgi:hypothetical protein
MASVREPTDSQMHPAIREMIDRYGVTPACREFLEEEQQQFIYGRFTAGQAVDRIDSTEPLPNSV